MDRGGMPVTPPLIGARTGGTADGGIAPYRPISAWPSGRRRILRIPMAASSN